MKRIRRLLLAAVIPSVIMGTIVGGALSAPALADTGARPLTLTSVQLQFTSFACLNPPSCSLAHLTIDGKGTSNLSTGAGSFHADVTAESAWSAVPALPLARFSRPLAEPAVRLSTQRALHGSCRQACSGRGQGLGILLPR